GRPTYLVFLMQGRSLSLAVDGPPNQAGTFSRLAIPYFSGLGVLLTGRPDTTSHKVPAEFRGANIMKSYSPCYRTGHTPEDSVGSKRTRVGSLIKNADKY